ncbi:MAG: helix-turn-helix domain-containing protein [Caldilineaceae bacterium]
MDMETDWDGTPRNREPEGARNRILDAALNIFSNKGYHDTRMDEIVDASHTSRAIYFHFPNKERLFLALVDQFANLLERRITEPSRRRHAAWPRCRQRWRRACPPSASTAARPRCCWSRPTGWVTPSSRSGWRSTSASPG